MAPVISLVERLPPSCDVQHEIVAVLEELLLQAKAGRIKSLAVTGTTPEGTVFVDAPPSSDQYRLIGAVSVLLHDLHNRAVGSDTVVEDPFDPAA